jgi:hypothetical protein
LDRPQGAGDICRVALVELDEGSFLGWSVTPLYDLASLQLHSSLPLYKIEKLGMLAMEPAYQAARQAGHRRFVAATKEV